MKNKRLKNYDVILVTARYFEKIANLQDFVEEPMAEEIQLSPPSTEDEITAETDESADKRAGYNYCSIIIDKASQEKLKNICSNYPELSILTGATEQQLMCHHITINMGTKLKVGAYQHGTKITVPVIEIAAHISNNSGIAAAMLSKDLIVDSGNPHVTLCLLDKKPGDARLIGVDPPKGLEKTFSKGVRIAISGYVNIPSEIKK